MFYNCYGLKEISFIGNEKISGMREMFYNCKSLKNIINLDTSKSTTCYRAFGSCGNLEEITVDFSAITDSSSGLNYTFNGCSKLKKVNILSDSIGNAKNLGNLFGFCTLLEEVPAWDIKNVTNLSDIVSSCWNLKRVHLKNIGANLTIPTSTQVDNFDREAMIEVMNNLQTVTTTKKLTFGSARLAKLTDEDKAIATNKGWTLA